MTNHNGSGTKRPKYALISPVRDEEAHIERTIRSVLGQNLQPVVWIIVSDGSTDRTEEIVESYARRYPHIELIRMSQTSERNFASKVRAFNHAYGLIWHLDFEFIGNLDGDVTLPPDYYERALKEFRSNPRLGIAGGVIFENFGGKYKKQDSSPRHTPGATQIFRRVCLEEIGGYLPLKGGGEDSAADIMARMKGWETHSFAHLRVHHQRRVGSGMGGMLRARYQAGATDHALGKHPLFVLLKSVRRLGEPLMVIGSLCRLLGFAGACLSREKRVVTRDFVRYVRQEQLQRLLPLRRANAEETPEVIGARPAQH